MRKVKDTPCSFFPKSLMIPKISKTDLEQIKKMLRTIVISLNDDFKLKNILALISSHAPSDLKDEMSQIILGPAIDFYGCFGYFKPIAQNKIKVKGFFYAKLLKGVNGENHFIFEKVKNKWRLLNTDFHRKLKPLFWSRHSWNMLKGR